MDEAPPKKTVTDLGIIRVETTGSRDTVYLTHNNLRAFALTCTPGKPSHFVVDPQFMPYSHEQWMEVFQAYEKWKRVKLPEFKLPKHSGRTKDGHQHPWRKARRKMPPKDTGPSLFQEFN